MIIRPVRSGVSLAQNQLLKSFKPQNVHLLAALPQEYRAFQRLFHSRWHQRHKEPFRQFHCRKGRQDFYLTETGMGQDAMLRALQWILSSTPHPDFLLSFGYAGSLSTDLHVGDVCLVVRVKNLESLEKPSVEFRAEPEMKDILRRSGASQPLGVKHGVKTCTLVTVKTLTPKSMLSSWCGEENDLMAVDMESLHVAQAAHETGLPLLILRAISDGHAEEIMLDPASIADSRGRLSPLSVLFEVAKKPSLVPFLIKSWKNSSLASRALALVLTSFLDNGCPQAHEYGWSKGLE